MVINIVLSVMAYDYPPEKLSVYFSDDGGSELMFYALLEASRFAKYWLPFLQEIQNRTTGFAAEREIIAKKMKKKMSRSLWLEEIVRRISSERWKKKRAGRRRNGSLWQRRRRRKRRRERRRGRGGGDGEEVAVCKLRKKGFGG
ncbi:Cellulose synthase-like protein E1 [Camellia lanceoleosa]|uniref:Cellulose synthase-like protein E1 n=1 Tax=Camellia lanceoleosa TaxID=1840588 RepID=A0ACC0FMN5_9ERIC|nr:Cellulose synthase-like protein E1 [Camellia lanceoleosa]